MRLLLCASAVLLLGACSSGSSDTTGQAATNPPGAPTPAAAAPSAPATATSAGASSPATGGGAKAGDAALKGNTDAICDQAARIGGEAAKTFAADLKLLKDAKSADADAAAQVDQKTTRDVQNYAAALADMAKLTTDAKLKKTLAGMGKQISALDGDVRKLNPDKLAGLQEDLSKACS